VHFVFSRQIHFLGILNLKNHMTTKFLDFGRVALKNLKKMSFGCIPMENYNLYYRETNVCFRRLCDLVIRGQNSFWNWKIT
jgi:hypothetical protein